MRGEIDFFAAFKLALKIKKENYDIIHCILPMRMLWWRGIVLSEKITDTLLLPAE